MLFINKCAVGSLTPVLFLKVKAVSGIDFTQVLNCPLQLLNLRQKKKKQQQPIIVVVVRKKAELSSSFIYG